MIERGLGVTVVNPAVEWVSAAAMTPQRANGAVDDADFAASLAAEQEEAELGEDHEVNENGANIFRTAPTFSTTVTSTLQQQVPVLPKPGADTTQLSVTQQPVVPEAAAGAGTGAGGVGVAPKLSCRKCKAFFDTRKQLGE